ncbi:MAG: TetR/AcrR family transcriptional regulator [Magnetococcales bacterium]|nr:TetR/AcrR family transcriptional regulator [Magnetococcales bacterium]
MKRQSHKAQETREKILRTATELFYVNGYHATGVDRIISVSEVSKGNFFYHFANKEELALAVLEWHREQAEKELDSLPEFHAPSPRDRLLAMLRMMARRSANYGDECDVRGCIFGNFAMEMSVESEAVRLKVVEILGARRRTLRQLLEESVRKGELPRAFDCDRGAGMILSLMQGAMVLDKASQEPREIYGVIAHIEAMLQRGATAPVPP